ncbi:hypothetical protein NC653_025945 [Populus alba x Populus x berolinensis]|uniref:Uncharacterized protein n=1 Tax=Populus alba x Populus x berolinensis TaxID=444605 RepID=A0AAD6MCZ1_9ROSI|nr:hypothetical protein NC653_025945 [Populus alba x Populus x berolinensis]
MEAASREADQRKSGSFDRFCKGEGVVSGLREPKKSTSWAKIKNLGGLHIERRKRNGRESLQD